MKKIIITLCVFGSWGCSKEPQKEIREKRVEKKIEKIVEVDPQVRKQTYVSHYLEELEAIVTSKTQSDALVTIDAHQGDIFLGVETTNGSSKTYSLQKLDINTGQLTPVISRLSEIKDVLISDTYIFITQNNTIKVYDRVTYELQVIIGSGTHAEPKGMHKAIALAMTQKHLIVRDDKTMRFYNLADIVQSNTQNIDVVVKSYHQPRNYGSLAIIDKKIYLSSLSRKEYLQVYHLNDDFLITNNQNFNQDISYGNLKAYELLNFREDLYLSLSEGGFVKIDKDTGYPLQRYETYKQQRIHVERFVVSGDKFLAINKTDGTILVYAIKDVVYKEY